MKLYQLRTERIHNQLGRRFIILQATKDKTTAVYKHEILQALRQRLIPWVNT